MEFYEGLTVKMLKIVVPDEYDQFEHKNHQVKQYIHLVVFSCFHVLLRDRLLKLWFPNNMTYS